MLLRSENSRVAGVVLLVSRRLSISLDIMVAESLMGDVWIDRQDREGMIRRQDQPPQDTPREMYTGLSLTHSYIPLWIL